MRPIIISLVSVLALLMIASALFNRSQSVIEPYANVFASTTPLQEGSERTQAIAAQEAIESSFFLVRLFLAEEQRILNQRLIPLEQDTTAEDPAEGDDSMTVNPAVQAYASYLSDTNPRVTMEVAGIGTMVLELFPEVAPNSVNNMIRLIQQGYYDGLVFHRVIAGFMIQGGWGADTGCQIAGEFSANGFNNDLKHTRGVLSMARTSVMDSATSQFFIMHQNSPHLDQQYAGFGALIEGFNVLDAIATSSTGFQDRPTTDIVMSRVTIDLRGYVPSEPVCVTP